MTAYDLTVQAADMQAAELDRILDRIRRADPILTLERESDRFWIVQDTANDLTMFRCPTWEVCDRFMRTFVSRNPGARIAEAAGFSVRVSERELTEAQPTAALGKPAPAFASVGRDEPTAPCDPAIALAPVPQAADQSREPASSLLPIRPHLTLYRGGTAA